MTAAETAVALGGARRSGQWWRCRCPVHNSRNATLALRDHPRGLAVRCHSGCSRDEILAELRRRGLIGGERRERDRWSEPVAQTRWREGELRDLARRIEMARVIWSAARNARETPLVAYLAARGINIPPPSSLRWETRCWHRERRAHLSAMIAAVRNVEGEVVAVHRTWLYRDPDGTWRRLDRASLAPTGGAAVRLAPAAETLLIGEGVETCLAAMQATSQPAWAALSTSGMTALVLPPIVRQVIILADHDANGAGERAARSAAVRWAAEGRRVRIALPPEPETDFNDVLVGRAPAVGDASDVAA